MTLILDRGPHKRPGRGVCAAEAVAFLVGEPHSDEPATLCPILGKTVRWTNDLMDDDGRRLLAPLVPRLAGTYSPAHAPQRAQAIAAGVCDAALDSHGGLDRALAWIGAQADPEDALARLEAETPDLAWLCAETLYGGPYEVVTQALTWLDSLAASRNRTRLWPPVVEGLARAILSGPYADWDQAALRARETALLHAQGRMGP